MQSRLDWSGKNGGADEQNRWLWRHQSKEDLVAISKARQVTREDVAQNVSEWATRVKP